VRHWPHCPTISRSGAAPRTKRSIRGLSWTLDRDKAIWFAKRFSMLPRLTPRLVEGFVHKRHVLAYFGGRKEKEIVSMHVDVRGVTVLSP
jgi:hypothetical protein